ncbi:2'-5' RNA ligase family protein [Micromonospora echinofusca]|uniref:RNA 2',3'-cyclic phosphodiesterase n=1 Tax=Micromonospora echinofusca TaxID=47858 RepID=A0ABS3VKM9_MICEH|nr:2'-5' RNA ligase family protein [Micromonospora echinofusca]MBO4205075.1 RNA 2',3'-cyclic phosphodiesterase [Micromonospora echinofusca]
MRLFVALYPPAGALDDIFAEVGRLRVGRAAAEDVRIRLVDRESAHITLAFLGDVDDDRLPEVTAALARAAAPAAPVPTASPPPAPEAPGVPPAPAPPVGPLRLRLAGGGEFGAGRHSVLWADVHGDVAALHALAGRIRSELHRAGLPYDGRPFRPHLTIARPQGRLDPEDVAQDRAALDRYRGPAWPATEMVLVRSHLGPRPLHHRLARWSL